MQFSLFFVWVACAVALVLADSSTIGLYQQALNSGGDGLCSYTDNRVLCVDPVTGFDFEVSNPNVPSGALEGTGSPWLNEIAVQYLNNSIISLNTEATTLAKRQDWLNCGQNDGTIEWYCCNTGNVLVTKGLNAGVSAMTSLFVNQLKSAFNGNRDLQSPRSICDVVDGGTYCTSWAQYSTLVASDASCQDIANKAMSCMASSLSLELNHESETSSGLTICVSGRATGCTQQTNPPN